MCCFACLLFVLCYCVGFATSQTGGHQGDWYWSTALCGTLCDMFAARSFGGFCSRFLLHELFTTKFRGTIQHDRYDWAEGSLSAFMFWTDAQLLSMWDVCLSHSIFLRMCHLWRPLTGVWNSLVRRSLTTSYWRMFLQLMRLQMNRVLPFQDRTNNTYILNHIISYSHYKTHFHA